MLQYARLDAGSWPLTITKEKNRFTVYLPEGTVYKLRQYLPEEARKLGLVPDAGQLAVIFSAGEILEIWPAIQWVENLRGAAANVGQLEKLLAQQVRDESNEE